MGEGVGASSVMRHQLSLNEIDSQVLIPQSFAMSVHALTHFCYHRRHQTIFISLKSQKK
jgi:hypothetical protein